MTEKEEDKQKLEQRLAWLEHRVVQLIWGACQLIALIPAWFVYSALDQQGWIGFAAAVAVWMLAGYIMLRYEFRRAPRHLGPLGQDVLS